MALEHSPNIIQDGLVLYYDMSNNKKSFIGKPTVNELAVPTPATNGAVTFQIQGTGTFYRITSGNYGGYEVQSNDVVYKYDLGLIGCHYHGTQKAVTAGATYTFSFDYYVSRNALDYPATNYLANIEIYETSTGSWVYQTGAGAGDPTPTIRGVWKTASFSITVPAGLVAPYANMLMYPGACGDTKMASSGFILYRNPQCEVSSFSTPFVSGTRSNTQALKDLTNNNILTTSSLTYNSNNTFQFNGTDNYITAGCNLGTTPTYTISFWAKRDSENNFPISWSGFYWFGDNSFYYTHGGVAGEYYYSKPTSIPLGTWGYYTVTYDGTKIVIYRQGIYQGQQATTGSAVFTPTIIIGNSGAGTSTYAWEGRIDAVQIYNRPLSDIEVLQNFNALRGRYGV